MTVSLWRCDVHSPYLVRLHILSRTNAVSYVKTRTLFHDISFPEVGIILCRLRENLKAEGSLSVRRYAFGLTDWFNLASARPVLKR